MRETTDTIFRQWTLLQLIPADAHRAPTTQRLNESLRLSGIEVGVRTIQRDLATLSTKFPLVCFTEGRTNYWHWMKGAPGLEIPAMTPATALTLQLARSYLAPILPDGVLGFLSPYMDRARNVLEDTKLADWDQRVCLLAKGQRLIQPGIDEGTQSRAMTALLEGCRFTCKYGGGDPSRPKQFDVSPLGLVVKGDVFYLVCTLFSYTDIRQLALHRMHAVKLLDEPATAPEGFDLATYIEEQEGFAYPLSPDTITLELLLEEGVAFHLRECKLSATQTLEKQEDERWRLRAEVKDTRELRWWLLGFGDEVEVNEPAALREEIAQIIAGMAARYL